MPALPIRILMGAASVALVTLLHYYLYRRIRLVVPLEGRRRRIAVALVFVLGAAVPGLGRLGYMNPTGVIGALGIGAWFLGILVLYAVLAVAAIDLSRVIRAAVRRLRAGAGKRPAPDAPADPARREMLGRIALGGVGLLSAGTSVSGLVAAAADPEVTDVEVPLLGLPPGPGVTVVHLTDIHIGAHFDAERVRRLVGIVNDLRPDVVMFTGDVVDRYTEGIERGVAELAGIRAPLGTFACLGNHEYWADPERAVAWLGAAGIPTLRNRRMTIRTPGGPIDVIGVDDHWARRTGRGYGPDLDGAVAGRDVSRPAILLCHHPKDFERIETLGIGLQLSGHLHGGQIFPIGLLQRLGYDWTEGLYRRGRSYLYVGRGVGTVGPPVRVRATPEIARIRLRGAAGPIAAAS